MILQITSCGPIQCGENQVVGFVIQGVICAFLAVLFLQSGMDKINDRKGNLEWMTSYFAKTSFKNQVGTLLTIVTFLEIISGMLCISGIISLVFKQCNYWVFWGCLASAITILVLFTGQRLAKDYTSAQGIISYLVIALIGLYLCR